MPTGEPHFRHRIEVRFRDLDVLRHVNNAVYFTYLEQARVAFWGGLDVRRGLEGLNVILARAECDYRRPVTLGDALEVRVWVGAVGRSSFTLDYELADPGSDRVFATARSVQVAYDFERARPTALPEELRTKLDYLSAGQDEGSGIRTDSV